jgi:hypothetical protein
MLSQSFVQVSKENATICDKGAIVNHLAARGKGKLKPKFVLSCIFHSKLNLPKQWNSQSKITLLYQYRYSACYPLLTIEKIRQITTTFTRYLLAYI